MDCPICGGPRSRVTDSREPANFNYVRRRRECLDCKHRWSTLEVRVDDLPDEYIKQIEAAMLELSRENQRATFERRREAKTEK